MLPSDSIRTACKMMLLFAAFLMAVISGPLPAFAQQSDTSGATKTTRVVFEARMTETTEALTDGVEWRIFGHKIGEDGKLPLLAQASGGVKAFDITPGEYFVHAAYGYSGAVRRIVVSGEIDRENFTLNAGAFQLNGVTSDEGRIPPTLLRFDVYSKDADERGERQLVARNVRPLEIVPVHAGTYHVVSQYGRLNAEVRADIIVEPGKVTAVTIQHRAARITFKLVKTLGGDAIADTAWSLLTESGDVITESSSAFPAFVLSEGSYTAIAKNADKIYSRDFEVQSGTNRDVEVLAE
ncbi:MAG: hypothetical protein WBO55_05610 [Rhizobiaceae bacterium]